MDPETFCSTLLNVPHDLKYHLGVSDELVKSSITIFAQLPMSRPAIIEYFSQYIFEKAISDYMSDVTKSPNRMEEDYNVLTRVQQGLTNLVFEHPSEFATPISNWSIQLLGKLSQKYDRIIENPSNNKVWMECDAVRALLSLAAVGFWKTKNIEGPIEKDECVNTLLETYIKYSPAADWIVARLASSYMLPLTTRVLYNGLCIFQKNAQNGNNMKPIVLILEQLIEGHLANVECAFKRLVQWSIAKNNRNNLRRFVIPFILRLAISDKLLPLVYSTILELLISPDAHAAILSNQRHHLWLSIGLKYIVIIEKMAEMALKIKSDGIKIIVSLLDKSEKCAFGLHILMQLLNEIGKEYRKSSEHYPLIISLSEHGDYKELCNILISPNVNTLKTAFILHILNYIGHCKPVLFPKIIHYLLYHITSISKLPLILQILQAHYFTGSTNNLPFSNLCHVLQMTFTSPKQSEFIYTFFWENLCNLIQQEKQGRTVFLEQGNFTKAALQHVSNIIIFFEEILDRKLQNITKKIIKEEKELNFKTSYYKTENGTKSSIFNMKTVCENQNHYSSICDNIARILEMLDINLVSVSNGVNRIIINNETYQKLVNVIVKFFFYSLLLRKPSRRRSSIIAIRLLNKCCSTNRIGRILSTQLLVDGAVFKYSLLFGATTPAYKNVTQSVSLFDLNIKQCFTSQMSQRPLAVFRNEMDLNRKTPSLITETCYQRQRLLLEALSAAMSENILAGPSTDALTSLSLWLVESVSTDVMYNGLPWPEDEFTKITMERDLHIRRMFQSTPVLWSLLRFVAYHRPALCYCSVLLRGLTSVLIYQWLSWSYKNTPDTIFQELHTTTKNVLQTLSLAQLLPPPLDTLAEVIPKLKPFEVSFVLKECVWFYMKENVPAPVLFQETQLGHYWRDPLMSSVPLRFIEPLRMVMQKHLPDLASNYNQIFIQGFRLNNLSK